MVLKMQTLDELFRQQVERTPDRLAVTYKDITLTFHELNQLSEKISYCIDKKLKQLNLHKLPSSELIIGVFLPRNLNLIASMLGVLKNGAAFLPLDPHTLQVRIEYMINDAQCSLILVDHETIQKYPWLNKYNLIVVDEIKDLGSTENFSESKDHNVTNTAYIIYTSGSTGQPKGVLTTHQSVVNRFEWLQKQYPFQESDVCCQKASIAYVDSIWELFFPLLHGINYVFIPDEVLLQPINLIDFLIQHKITRFDCPPSLLKVILSTLETTQKKLPLLQLWVVSGEEVLPEIVEMFYKIFPFAILLNRYGSTEATSYMWYNLKDWDGSTKHIPIGRPIDNATVYVLDYNLEIVPPGAIGELCVSGICLAKGYLSRPDLESKVFVSNRYNQSGMYGFERMYKTGDLVRQLPSGHYEYIGRVDHRIKFRGHTIEPFEIEDHLRAYPGVQDALVVLKEFEGQPDLIAYLISDHSDDQQIENNENLIAYLKELIPEFMIPNFFVLLDRFPLNKSGKIARNLLPLPKIITTEENDDIEDDFEQRIAAIWKEVLRVKSVSRECNFFLLGGHSLAAMQIAMEIQKKFNIIIDASDLLKYPTIAQLASHLLQNPIDRQKSLVKDEFRVDANPLKTNAYPPLSSMQRQLWFLEKQSFGISSYHMPFVIRLDGSLDYVALTKSFNQVVKRHDILRTVFKTHDDKPYQFIKKSLQVEIPVIEASESSLDDLLSKSISEPFDLVKGPLLRVTLFRLTKLTNILLVNQHHIISDDGSVEIMLNELSLWYQHYQEGSSFELPKIVQYKQFCFWQQKQLANDSLLNQINYWKQKLLNYSELAFITDFTRPPVMSAKGGCHDFVIDSLMVEQLSVLVKENQCTLFMFFLSAISVLIYRYSQYEDIIIGSPITLRDQNFSLNMMGMFLNTLPLRIDLSGSPTFLTVLERAKQVCLEAFANKYVPLEEIINAQKIVRTVGKNPLFQVMFAYQDQDLNNNVNLTGIKSTIVDTHNDTAKMDLLFSFRRDNNQFKCRIEYSSALFLHETITRMAGHFTNLLASIIEQNNCLINRLSIISDAEYRTLLVDRNETYAAFSHLETVHSLFEKKAAENPHHFALITDQEKITYQELNQLSNQIAHYISKLKSKEKLIAICLDRSKEQIASILAIWKCGAAYVPIDPHYPESRKKYLLEDSGCKIIITTTAVVKEKHLFQGIPQDRLILIDENIKKINRQSTKNLDLNINSSALAQVIYTSGSTGNPKGVMLEHMGIVNRLQWMQSRYGLSPDHKFLNKTPFIFDVSVGEIFWPLTVGATLVLAREGGNSDFEYLIRLIDEYQITHTHFVPNGLATLLKLIKQDDNHKKQLSSLTHIFCSGEELPSKLVKEFFNYFDIELHNIYGPTEAGEVSSYQCGVGDNNIATISIGKPIDNVRFYILDANLNPVPVGAIGELYIAGAALARGYYNHDELTNQRFIYHTFEVHGTKINERLYKTGDLVYWLSNGDVAYIGRNDFQVKIKGFRIELGEIEQRINQFDGILQSVVLAQTINQEKYLVAYFTSEKQITNPDVIKQKLAQQLPSYMVPSFLIQVKEFPLTNTGKINRLVLPIPAIDQLRSDESIVSPNDLIEYKILKIWQEVLGITTISVMDNFFDIGGHSLLSVQLIALINKEFTTHYPVSWVFEFNNIYAQAQFLRTQVEIDEYYQPILAINPQGNSAPLIFIHPGHAGSEVYMPLASELDRSISFYAIDSYNLYYEPFVKTIEELASHYLQYVKTISPRGPYFLGGWSLGGIIAYEMAQQLTKQGLTINHVYLIDSSTYLSNRENPMAGMPQLFMNYLDNLPNDRQQHYRKLIVHESDMLEKYLPSESNFPVTIFCANEAKNNSSQQWLSLVPNLDVVELSADHYTIMQDLQLTTIASLISNSIKKFGR